MSQSFILALFLLCFAVLVDCSPPVPWTQKSISFLLAICALIALVLSLV